MGFRKNPGRHIPRAARLGGFRLRARGDIASLSVALFAPLRLSILDQLEKVLSASRICPFRVQLPFQLFFCGKEVQRIEYFVGQRISKRIHASAYCADWNKVVLIGSYARLGAHKAPTDIRPDSLEK